MINDHFVSAVQPLRVPEMGTDSTAPLLYWLVRTLRPRTVLEVGMGYTTPFLAQALKDNKAAFEEERNLLTAGDRESVLPLAHAAYYEEPHEPVLVCIDRMTDASSSAPRAQRVLEDLGLSDVCQVIEGDLRGSSDRVKDAVGLLDFAWIDTWDTLAFVREYWDLINPAGGVFAAHYLMTYPEGRAVLRYLESMRGREGGRMEITNLREPHRFAQNSTTLIRRIRDYADPEDLRPRGNANDPVGVLEVR
ncbi:hypothetical protein GCM10022254_06270 [Actinomadura meridiana]|uniref:Methyltransferase n=1 Tax=Actinomadura meridiana TaxID=559626 RepID=A0ABP8BST8_9ACTN